MNTVVIDRLEWGDAGGRVLFLGVNEGNLNDNTGSYEAVIEAETGR